MNWPSSLFTLWRVQPTIDASSPWVSVVRSRIAPSGERPVPPSVGEADQARGQAAGDVEEVQLLDVGGQPAELAGERREQGVADGRLGGDQLAEPVARQDDGLRGRERGRGRRPRRAVEQGQLAEDVAAGGASRGWPRRRSSDGSEILTSPDTMMNRASPGSPSVEDHLAPPEPPRPRAGGESLEGASGSSPAKNGIGRQ